MRGKQYIDIEINVILTFWPTFFELNDPNIIKNIKIGFYVESTCFLICILPMFRKQFFWPNFGHFLLKTTQKAIFECCRFEDMIIWLPQDLNSQIFFLPAS